MKKHFFPILSSLILTILPLFFSSVVALLVINHETQIENFGFFAWLLVSVICCFTSILSLTAPTIIALIFGYFLGWKAIFPLLLLNMGAILLINIIIGYLDKQKINDYLADNKKVKEVLNSLHNDELRIIFFTKLSPVLPFVLTNLVFSLSGAKLKNILLGGFLGMIPRTLLAIWTGMQAKEIRYLLEHPNEGNSNKILLILLAIASLVGVFWVVKKSLDKK